MGCADWDVEGLIGNIAESMAEEYEEFEWKAPKDIWKGVGIYHITFTVAGRKRLLGELVAEYPDVSRLFIGT